LIDAAAILSNEVPGLQFAAAMASPEVRELFEIELRNHTTAPEILRVEGRAKTVMAAADVVICASGTATLEAMLINRPMVSVYRLAPATYLAAKSLRLIRRQFFALPNILAQEALVPELIQQEVTAEKIATETRRWLDHRPDCEKLSQRFAEIHRSLLEGRVNSAAQAVCHLIEEKT